VRQFTQIATKIAGFFGTLRTNGAIPHDLEDYRQVFGEKTEGEATEWCENNHRLGAVSRSNQQHRETRNHAGHALGAERPEAITAVT
jgi:hypothetical protein